MERFSSDLCGRSGELEFAWDHILGEIPLADETGDHINFLGVDQVNRLAHGWLFFPEAAMDFGEKASSANLVGMFEIGSRGIWILCGAVTDDEEGACWLGHDGHAPKLARRTRNARVGII